MWNILRCEWLKLHRCQILLVGITAMILCPVTQYGTQLVINPEMRDSSYDLAQLFANVIWGNTQIFLPISLVMTGGWLIDRENTNDTMKNNLAIPVPYRRLLTGKLIMTILLALIFGLCSGMITLLTGIAAGLSFPSPPVAALLWAQTTAAAMTTCLVCMPMILFFGQLRGAYLSGSLLAFFLGYCILFFKSGPLLSAYPFSAALILAGFDMEEFNGAAQPPSIPLALAGMTAVLALTALILLLSCPVERNPRKQNS